MTLMACIEHNIHAEKLGNIVKPKQLSKEVFRKYGVNINYYKSWRAKKMAMQTIQGT